MESMKRFVLFCNKFKDSYVAILAALFLCCECVVALLYFYFFDLLSLLYIHYLFCSLDLSLLITDICTDIFFYFVILLTHPPPHVRITRCSDNSIIFFLLSQQHRVKRSTLQLYTQIDKHDSMKNELCLFPQEEAAKILKTNLKAKQEGFPSLNILL